MTWLISLFLVPPWTAPINEIDVVEFNTFGAARIRTAVIYRHANGEIAAWRWYTHRNQIPYRIRAGVFLAVWDDNGKPRQVRCRQVIYTRTVNDVELEERKNLPYHKRTKLK